MGFFDDVFGGISDFFDDITFGIFGDTQDFVADLLGVGELASPDTQRALAEKEIQERLEEERERLQAQLNSASAKERIEAEKELELIETTHKRKMKKLRREAQIVSDKMDKTLKNKLATQEEDTPTKPKFDLKKVLRLRNRVIKNPIIGPRPGQGTVIPRPTPTSLRSGQNRDKRPK